MEFLKAIAIQQAIVWVAFSILAVGGALAQRRWGWAAAAVVVVLSWPVFMTLVLLDELRMSPPLFELNAFGVLFRNLWTRPTVATAALALSLWLMRRTSSTRRRVFQGVAAGAVWAFVMPVPLALVAIGLASVIPMGTAEYHYVDFEPMGLEVRGRGTPSFRHYSGGEIALRYRAALDGRELEVEILPAESLTAQFSIRAVTPNSPVFELDEPVIGGCAFTHWRERDNTISVTWSTVPEARGMCYGEGAPDAHVTFHFAGSATSLTLHGPVVKGGDYYFYDSL